ncbi:hypothetical protein L6164_031300 [Bauhinia variegata]|uniref:Uncharacterized protein n=1 Tax=Bauhinia variegata TaxID=167791 RepID=A0ACB9LFH7_BAUVA|nr:hypothetical protein L6164_031300 [Bauhinia variegata]
MASSDIMLLKELAIAILIFVISHIFFRSLLKTHDHRKLPPGPRGWPILGALPLLGPMPHVTLAKWAKNYGPVMCLKMGVHNMVVASTPDAARAFLKTLDVNFSNRPSHAGPTHMAYDSQDMVFSDYGPKWNLLRKLSNLHMLGGKALDDWSEVRAAELGHMLRSMFDSSRKGEAVVVPELLSHAIVNMIGQVILRRRVFETHGSESNEFKDMVVEHMTVAGYFNIGDFIPFLSWLDLQGIERRMKRVNKKFDLLLIRMIEEHQALNHERKGKPDFLDVLMAQQENADGERLTITNIKALLLDLFTAGTDTSSSIIEWALSEMLKNPSIMKRAHEEMDQVKTVPLSARISPRLSPTSYPS